jgi:hypothetical protein
VVYRLGARAWRLAQKRRRVRDETKRTPPEEDDGKVKSE